MDGDTPDPDGGSGGREPTAIEPASHAHRTRSGAELVALAERFNHGIFLGAMCFVGLSTLTALAFLPLRTSAEDGVPPASAVAAALIVLVLAGLAAWRARDVDRMLRRHPSLELVPVLVAAILLSVVSPLRNELWWSASAILMVLALRVSLRRALTYCLIVLVANLTAHLVSGDLSDTSARGVIGLWIGLPFWTAMAAVVPDRMASYILRLNVRRNPPRAAPLRVIPRPTRPAAEEPTADTDGAVAAPKPASATTNTTPATTSRLTAKQLEVVALLAAGYRYEYIGACLSITAGQVYRHVRNAIARLGVETVNELVAVAVAEGLIRLPPPGDTGETVA